MEQFKEMNQTLLLDSAQIWQVSQGEVALFAVLLKNGQPAGNRRYLFTISAGELVCGITPASGPQQLVFLAVAVEATELLLITSLETPAAPLTPPLAAGLTTWLQKLGQFVAPLAQTVLQFMPSSALQILGRDQQTYSLKSEQCLQPRRGQLVWVKVEQGRLTWLGQADWPLTPEVGWFPLSGLWLAAQESTEMRVTSLEALTEMSALLPGLWQLHTYILQLIEQLEEQEQLEAYVRFRERKRLGQESLSQSLSELAGVLTPHTTAQLPTGDPLLVAAGAVGHALGVAIVPPTKSENLAKLKVPLEAIARASHLRMRRVLLRGRWWQRDAGPLVAFRANDSHPLALLPQSGGAYQLFDPLERASQPLTPALANQIDPVAYTFYRGFPNRPLQALDLLKFALGPRRRELVMIGLCLLVGTLLSMVTPQATAILINDAIPDANRGLLFQVGLGLVAAMLGTLLFQLTQTFSLLRLETLAEADTSAAIWDRLLNVEVPFLRHYSTGDLEARISAIEQMRRRLTGTTLQTLLGSFFALLNLGLLVYYSPTLAAIALGVTVLSLVVTTGIGWLSFSTVQRLQQIQGEITGLVVELITGIAKLRVAGAEARAFSHWAQQYARQQRLSLHLASLGDALGLFNEVLPVLSSLILFWVVSGQLGQLNIGTFLAFNTAFTSFIHGATGLSNSLLTLQEVTTLWQRAKPILDAKLEVDDHKADPGQLVGKVVVDHVSFRYHAEGAQILEDVSFTAEPGEFIALVGPSGSGKSTLLRLLLGFETPQSGKICLDGQDLASLNLQAVRRQLGVVIQNGKLTAGSIFDNIAAGGLLSLDEAWEAAQGAGLEADIRSFPMGMHTVVSEGGSNLSGGQRQRLLIARALALQPRILLFDEATSALDNHTQAIVSASLERLRVTRITIAHRLSTIRHADRIYVLQAGRVVEQGRFEELIGQAGVFYQLMANQQL